MTIAKSLLIDGRVQGVFFRAATRREARSLRLRGWVKNLPDGRVAAFVQGDPKVVDHLVRWCRSGPPMARVDQVSVSEAEPDERLSGFEVRY